MKKRVQWLFDAWYQPECYMDRDDVIYILAMLYMGFMSFWIAFFITYILV